MDKMYATHLVLFFLVVYGYQMAALTEAVLLGSLEAKAIPARGERGRLLSSL